MRCQSLNSRQRRAMFIDKWEIIEKQKGKLDIGMVEITLPDWLYQGITQTKILKISHDYFRIRKAIDRRLYEIARKHCGSQHEFIITLEKLLMKLGSTTSLKDFRQKIKPLCITNDLPDYKIFYDSTTDKVIFTNRNQDSKSVKQSKLQSTGKKNIYAIKKQLGIHLNNDTGK